jgi:two-component system, LytTR family, sensor kinase
MSIRNGCVSDGTYIPSETTVAGRIGYVRTRSGLLVRIGLAYLWSIGFWTMLLVLMTWQEFVVQRAQGLQINFFQLLMAFSIREDLTFALLTPPIFFLVRRFAVALDKPGRGLLAYMFGFVPFVICYGCLRWMLAEVSRAPIPQYVPGRSALGLVTMSLGDAIAAYIAIVFSAHAYEYFDRARAQEREQHRLQQALAASELQALKSQLHPHFLFNILHGISSLIDSDRRLAKTMIVKLSHLLRTALQHGSSDLVSLQEEIKFIESYLDLEKMRLGSRLDVRWEINPDALHVLVPQLILQPVVENAILHGIACCREGGWLQIAAQRTDGIIEIQVRNSIGATRNGGMGFGLTNTEARLKCIYSDEAKFSFAINQERIAIATLAFPTFGLPEPSLTKAEAGVLD